jgi:hypothetical protein
MEGFWWIDSGSSQHMTGDRRWFSSFTPVMTKEYTTFGDNGKGRVLSVGTVKVNESEDHVWFEVRWMVASLCDE